MQTIGVNGEDVFRATFYEFIGDETFYVKSKELHSVARPGMQYRLSFVNKENESICSFMGEVECTLIRSSAFLTLLKKLTDIEETAQRRFQREEMFIQVSVYHLSENAFHTNAFDCNINQLVQKTMSFDVSAGGMCIVCNGKIEKEGEPYYLLEFSVNNEQFVIPARIVREGNAPQMVNYRYDYGFEFQYDHLPGEETRLLGALLNSKMALLGRR